MQVSTDDSQSEERVDRSISSPPIQSSQIYQAAIATDDKIISNCLDVPSRSGFPTETHRHWYLGLSYLLAGKEDEAQAAWNVPLSIASTTEIDTYTNELALILDREAQAQAQNSDLKTAWTIRQHLWTISPTRLGNILQKYLRRRVGSAHDPNKCEEKEKERKCEESGRRVLYRGDDRKPGGAVVGWALPTDQPQL